MPPKARAFANNCIFGAWQHDTFTGKKWEIENVLWETMCEVLDSGRDWLRCRLAEYKQFDVAVAVRRMLVATIVRRRIYSSSGSYRVDVAQVLGQVGTALSRQYVLFMFSFLES